MLRIREYETIFVLRPDISDVDADRVTERMRTAIQGHDGKIAQIENWGKRKLAYEIAKQQKGIYVYWRFIGNNQVVRELERNLRLMEPVLRFLTVRLKEEVDPDSIVALPDGQIPMRSAGKRPPEPEPVAPQPTAEADASAPAEATAEAPVKPPQPADVEEVAKPAEPVEAPAEPAEKVEEVAKPAEPAEAPVEPAEPAEAPVEPAAVVEPTEDVSEAEKVAKDVGED